MRPAFYLTALGSLCAATVDAGSHYTNSTLPLSSSSLPLNSSSFPTATTSSSTAASALSSAKPLSIPSRLSSVSTASSAFSSSVALSTVGVASSYNSGPISSNGTSTKSSSSTSLGTGLGSRSRTRTRTSTRTRSTSSRNNSIQPSIGTAIYTLLPLANATVSTHPGTGSGFATGNTSTSHANATAWEKCQTSLELWSNAESRYLATAAATKDVISWTVPGDTTTYTFVYGTADVFTTISGYPYAQGNFTATSTSISSTIVPTVTSTSTVYQKPYTYPKPSPTCEIDPAGCTSAWQSYLHSLGLPTFVQNATEPRISPTPTNRPRCSLGEAEIDCMHGIYTKYPEPCHVYGGIINLYYWPPSNNTNATVQRQAQVTATMGNMTFTSPSVYISIATAYAERTGTVHNPCSAITSPLGADFNPGQQLTAFNPAIDMLWSTSNAWISAHPASLSTLILAPPPGVPESQLASEIAFDNYASGNLKTTSSLLNPAYITMPRPEDYYLGPYPIQSGMADGAPASLLETIFLNAYKPILSIPSELIQLNSKLHSCRPGIYGLFDPPIALTQQNAPAMPAMTTHASSTTVAPVPGSKPLTTVALTTSPTTSILNGAGSKSLSSSGGSANPTGSDSSADPTGGFSIDSFSDSGSAETGSGSGVSSSGGETSNIGSGSAASPTIDLTVSSTSTGAASIAGTSLESGIESGSSPGPTAGSSGAGLNGNGSGSSSSSDDGSNLVSSPSDLNTGSGLSAHSAEPTGSNGSGSSSGDPNSVGSQAGSNGDGSSETSSAGDGSGGSSSSGSNAGSNGSNDDPSSSGSSSIGSSAGSDNGSDPSSEVTAGGGSGGGISSNTRTSSGAFQPISSLSGSAGSGPDQSESVGGSTTAAVVVGSETFSIAVPVPSKTASPGTESLSNVGGSNTQSGNESSNQSAVGGVSEGSSTTGPDSGNSGVNAQGVVEPTSASGQNDPTDTANAATELGSQTAVITVGSSVLTITKPSHGGSTVQTINGQTVDVQPDGVVAGTAIVSFAPATTASITGVAFSIGGKGVTATKISSGVFAVGGSTAVNGQAITFSNGQIVSVNGNSIIFGSSAMQATALPSLSPEATSIAAVPIGGSTLTATALGDGDSAVIGGQTISVKGSPVTLPGGEIVSLSPLGMEVVKDGTTSAIAFTDQDLPNATPVVTFSKGSIRATATEVQPGVFAYGSQTFSAGGPAITVSGATVSANSAGIVVDGSTVTASPNAPAEKGIVTFGQGTALTTATEVHSGVFVYGTQTLSVGGSAVTMNGQTISANSAGLVVDGSTIAATLNPLANSVVSFSVGSAMATATEIQSGVFVYGTQTISAGGSAITFQSETISANSAGLVVDGSVIPASSNPFTEAITFSLGSTVATATELSPGAFVYGTQTLTAGGSAVVVSGETISAASSGLVVGNQTITVSESATGTSAATSSNHNAASSAITAAATSASSSSSSTSTKHDNGSPSMLPSFWPVALAALAPFI